MKAVAYRVRCLLRARWRSTVALGLVVAAVSGVVLALAAGAHRTATAPDRYTAASGGGHDGTVQQGGGPPRTAEVAGLPGVASVDAVTFMFAGLLRPGGGEPVDATTFAGSYRAIGMNIVQGRAPEPGRPDELVATRNLVDAAGVRLGTAFDLVTLSQEQADSGGYEAFAAEGPKGPRAKVTLVGVIDGPTALDDPTPFAVVPASFLEKGPGVALTIMSVGLRPGTSLDELRRQLDTLPDGEALGLEPADLITPNVRTAVDGQANGFWLLAAVAAAAAVVALGQLVTRSVRLTSEERPSLEALGFDRSQLLAESALCAGLPIVGGAVLGVALAAVVSPAFPTGFVRRIEPHPGLRVDAAVLGLGALAAVVSLLLWALAALLTERRNRGPERPSELVEWIAVRCRSAALSTGFRFAFTRARRDRGSVRATVTGMLLIAGLLVGTVVFGSSLDRLVTDGDRFGHTYDLLAGSGGEVVPDELLTALESDADVAALTVYGTGHARVGQASLGLAGVTQVKGDSAPPVLSGRLPGSDDEIGLGRLAAEHLDAEVGDELTVETAGGDRRFRVTGLVVVPPIEELAGVGQDAVVTMGGLRRADPEATPSTATVRLRTGAPPGTSERLGIGPDDLRPAVILNLARIRFVPYLLAALVGALAVLTVVHVMLTSVHHRRRDVALLRSLGAEGRWVNRALRWQATTFALVPLALGAPLGLIAGRLVFGRFADSVGAVPAASFPFAVLAAVTATFVVLANLVAAVPSYRARRLKPARLLTTE